MEGAPSSEIPFYAALALAGLLFVAVQALARHAPLLRNILPLPILAGLLGAVLLLLPRAAGWPIRVPHQGTEVDVLIGLLTTNMGLHLTPKVLRQGAPIFAVFVLAGVCLYGLQLLAAFPVAFLSEHPLKRAVLMGPLSYLGAPYNLNPPSQVPPVADLLRPAFLQPEETAQGMMMLGARTGQLTALCFSLERQQTGQWTVMITRRFLLGGAAALAASSLAGCSSKLRTYDGPPVTGIVVNKGPRRMYLLNGNTTLRAFDIELGGDPIGPKRIEGDMKTPEGAYYIDRRNPNSSYYLSLGISYPSPLDLAYAQAMGVSPGGNIFIHGTPREKRRNGDWTAGCIAVTNREMEDIYAMVGEGTPIHLNP